MSTKTPNPLVALVARLWRGWATRSLAVGAVATLVDVCVLLVCVKLLGFPNPFGFASGVTVGSTVAFLGNRIFAFPDRDKEMRPQLIRFAATVGVGLALHVPLGSLLADHFGVPVVLAKLIADMAVFGVGQLFVLRYVVFPKAKHPEWLRALGVVPAEKKNVRDSAARAA